MLKTIQLNVYNIRNMRQLLPQSFESVLLDANNDCNLHCVYCHNPRSKELIDTNDFRRFLEENVISVNFFQVGCGMEPTLDPRLCDLMLMVAHSRARPNQTFRLQTNGIMLHRHDYGKMREAGLNELSVSIDSAEPAIHKALRGGSSLSRVHANLLGFRDACPTIKLMFITTVTSQNIAGIQDLITFGLDAGVSEFVFRQMFYFRESNIVDHSKMRALILTQEAFNEMREGVSAKFGHQANLHFFDSPTLLNMSKKTRTDSLY